jgi:hypothetical protein
VTGDFPSTTLDHLLLVAGYCLAAAILTLLVPRRWGWWGFPLVLIGTLFVTTAGTIAWLTAAYAGRGYNLHFGVSDALVSSLVSALVFWAIRRARGRASVRGG